MTPLALYCKSFHTDLKRVVRLAQSIERFNADQLPFFVSVPHDELALFREHLQGLSVTLIDDDVIVAANSRIDLAAFHQLPGNIGQQIVKSEFWRLDLSEAYLCLDSDSIFIRPFYTTDFIAPGGIPYTVMDEAHDLLWDALQRNKQSVIDNFHREAKSVQTYFERTGKSYSFGPMPLVWHRAVWESLDTHYLNPQGINFMDAILQAPLESRWYGEALLRYQAVALLPSEPFFKVYHYAWQLDQDTQSGMTFDQLAPLYSGVIFQSSWEREMDWPTEGGNIWSHIGRRIRRKLGRM